VEAIMIQINNILVPTDFSEPADAAIQYAKALASEFGSRVHLLHVVPEPVAYPWGTELSTFSLANILSESETGALERLQAFASSLGVPANRIVTQAAVGRPVDKILDYISTERIDLVVMGTHGRGAVGHLLVGSVAERIVRRSPVPVLTVHSAPAAAAEREARLHREVVAS
jgi:nucleotide-binding universal stress UspA family protein